MSTNAFARPLGFSEPPLSPTGPTISAVRAHHQSDTQTPVPELHVTSAPHPEWIARVTLACLEVAYGRRSVQQLRSITTRTAIRKLELLQQTRSDIARHHLSISCGPVRICAPSQDALEVSATAVLGHKAFPLAIRMEYLESRWTVCEIEMGPH